MSSSRRAPPGSTYRLQLHPDLGFDGAAGWVDYLAALGVSHLYCSPILAATPGSTHGYDVVDPTVLDPALGGRLALDRLTARLRAHGMGLVVDIVPNHLAAASPDNPWWWDVLAHGPDSAHADFFDIDWDPSAPELEGRVLVPLLGRPLPDALAAGEVILARDPARGLVIRCAGQTLPLELPPADARALAAPLPDAQPGAHRMLAALARQRYALTHWRRARTHLNYRRFFTITSMISVRAEEPAVFDATHAAILPLVRDGHVDGLRVDHPDGLRDPAGYLERLARATGDTWTVVEKILAPRERLPPGWRAAGTTGYDFAAVAGGLFVDPGSEAALTALYAEITGAPTDWDEVVHRSKLLVMHGGLAPELERLAALIEATADPAPAPGRASEFSLAQALVELLACLGVYRTYVRPEDGTVADADVRAIGDAAARARARRPDLGPALDELTDLLLPHGPDAAALIARLQQTSGAVMAKGVEDTAMYTFNRFIALNEVGADPSRFGSSPEEFHGFCLERQARWPDGLSTLSTHDTKRSVDVRARLYALSERPAELGAALRRWTAHNRGHRQGDWPDRNAEYLLYQTLLGAHPLPLERARAFMEKAAREAKAYTSWTEPDREYEQALGDFIAGVLGDPWFADDLAAEAAAVIPAGRANSLALALLCATAPGVPDVYQGTELWDLSLVDPDNRRPVDLEARRAALAALAAAEPASDAAALAIAHTDDGWPKLWVWRQALELRRRWPEVFGGAAAYRPLFADGPRARHLVAFERHAAADPDGRAAITCVTRLGHTLGGDWRGTTLRLPRGRWRDLLTGARRDGGRLPVAALFGPLPVALWVRQEPS